MSRSRPTPQYNGGNGNQLRDKFREINDSIGSEVVTNIHKITNTRLIHPYRASGRQLRIAFEQINAHAGETLVDLSKIQNITNGIQLAKAFENIQIWIDSIAALDFSEPNNTKYVVLIT